jgi:hypothetical protein
MNKHIELPIAGNLWGSQTTSFTGVIVATEKEIGNPASIGVVFCAPQSDTITHIGFAFSAATGGNAKTFRMELRNVNSDGSIGSTIYANSATLAHTVIGTTYTTATTTNPVVAQIPLVTPYAVTAGSIYAIVHVAIGGTWSPTSYMNFISAYGALPRSFTQTYLPYLRSGSPVVSTNVPIFLAVSATKFYGAAGPYRQEVEVGGTTTAYGNFFTLPATFGTSVRLSGVKIAIRVPVGPYNEGYFTIKVYNSNGSTLYVDNTFWMNCTMNNSPNNEVFIYHFDSAVTLNPGSTYFIGVTCPSDSVFMNCFRIDNYPEDFDKVRKMNTGGLINLQGGQVTAGGSVAVTDAYYFPINPLIDLINPAASGGGTSTTAGFNQGLFN